MDNLFQSSPQHLDQVKTARECFAELSQEEYDFLKSKTSVVEYSKGEYIIKQGVVANHIMVLEKGLAKLDVINDGQLSSVSLIGPESFIGIICLFANQNFDFSTKAVVDCSVSLIDRQAFDAVIRRNGSFASKLVRHMSFLTNKLVHHITRTQVKNAAGALAINLLDFARVLKSNQFELPLTRVELAEMCGYSRESVIHALSNFNREGIVEIKDKKVKIIDREKLILISKRG